MKEETMEITTVTNPLLDKTLIIVLTSPDLMYVTGLDAETAAPFLTGLYLHFPD